MAPREPKSMAEIHAIRQKLDAQTKRMTLHQKFAWITKQAKMLGVPEDYVELKKAS